MTRITQRVRGRNRKIIMNWRICDGWQIWQIFSLFQIFHFPFIIQITWKIILQYTILYVKDVYVIREFPTLFLQHLQANKRKKILRETEIIFCKFYKFCLNLLMCYHKLLIFIFFLVSITNLFDRPHNIHSDYLNPIDHLHQRKLSTSRQRIFFENISQTRITKHPTSGLFG